MLQITTIIIAALLSENYVLVKFLGICPFLGVSKRINAAVGMGMAVTFVMVLASVLCYFAYQLLILLDLTYMQSVAFILILASSVQLVEMFLKKKVRSLYNALGVYLPLITTNCAVLAVVLANAQNDYNLLLSVINGGASGLGFALAIVLFASLRERVDKANPPACFKGYPIALIAAGLLALAFMGFSGMKIP